MQPPAVLAVALVEGIAGGFISIAVVVVLFLVSKRGLRINLHHYQEGDTDDKGPRQD